MVVVMRRRSSKGLSRGARRSLVESRLSQTQNSAPGPGEAEGSGSKRHTGLGLPSGDKE